MRYYNVATNTTLTINEVRQLFPDMSIPEGADMSEHGYEVFKLTEQPAALPFHRVVEAGSVTENRQVWVQQPFTEIETIRAYTDALERLFDQAAQSRRYDSRITCALRAGYSGPFQAEGQAFALWMDSCNALGYSILDKVKKGTMPQPGIDAFIAMMPGITWPSAS